MKLLNPHPGEGAGAHSSVQEVMQGGGCDVKQQHKPSPMLMQTAGTRQRTRSVQAWAHQRPAGAQHSSAAHLLAPRQCRSRRSIIHRAYHSPLDPLELSAAFPTRCRGPRRARQDQLPPPPGVQKALCKRPGTPQTRQQSRGAPLEQLNNARTLMTLPGLLQVGSSNSLLAALAMDIEPQVRCGRHLMVT